MNDFNIDFWLLNDEKSITVYDNDLARVTSIEEAVFIRRFLYLWRKFDRQPIFIVPEKFCLPVGISIYSFRKITKQWEAQELIKTECRGLPLKKYYSINEENLSSYLNNLKYSDKNLDKISCRIREDKLSDSTRYIISNNNKTNILPETSCSGDQPNLPKPISGTERKLQKIYEQVLVRIETLSEKGVIPAVRKLTSVRSALIKDRIKEEPSLPYWTELFDRIENDADIYSKENWFDFHFLFRAESKKGGNSREKVLSGHYDFLRRDKGANYATDVPFDQDEEGNEIYLELKALVKDTITEEKMDELVQIIEKVDSWQRPDNHFIDGKSRRGFINYRETFNQPWQKVYQYHVACYCQSHATMPKTVSMVKVGSDCWREFENLVGMRWTTICFTDELVAAQQRFDNKVQ